VELIKASNSNPLIGLMVAVVSTDILNRTGVISKQAYNIMMAIIGISFTVDEVGAVTAIVSKIFGQSTSSIKDLITPSATTIVYAAPGPGAPAPNNPALPAAAMQAALPALMALVG